MFISIISVFTWYFSIMSVKGQYQTDTPEKTPRTMLDNLVKTTLSASKSSGTNMKFGVGTGLPVPHFSGSDSHNESVQLETQVCKISPSVPKIPPFSGDDPPQKGDVSYVEWRFEVKCLEQDTDLNPSVVIQAIRRSLRGTARKMLIPLGEKALVVDIIAKLDALFGDISTSGMVMQDFYNSFQGANESVTAFGCRLESMLQIAIESGHLDQASKNETLKEKFWTSLNSDSLKAQTRYKFETIQSYDVLLREVRKVEKELSISNVNSLSHSQSVLPKGNTNKTVHHKPVISNPTPDLITQLEKKFDEKLDKLKNELETRVDRKFDLLLNKLNDVTELMVNNSSDSVNGVRGRGRGFSGTRNFHGRGRGNGERLN